MLKNCLIYESNSVNLEELMHYMSKITFVKIVKVTTTYEDTVSYLFNHNIDFMFIGLNKKTNSSDLNGINVLKTVMKLPQNIIISEDALDAVEAYNIGKSTDFILKPFSLDRLLIAIDRTLSDSGLQVRNSQDGKKIVFFKMGRHFSKFDLNQVLYFQSYGVYLKVYTERDRKPSIINEAISTICDKLHTEDFMRIHKSYVINLDKITGFDGKRIFFNDFSISIGSSYREKLLNKLKIFGNIIDFN